MRGGPAAKAKGSFGYQFGLEITSSLGARRTRQLEDIKTALSAEVSKLLPRWVRGGRGFGYQFGHDLAKSRNYFLAGCEEDSIIDSFDINSTQVSRNYFLAGCEEDKWSKAAPFNIHVSKLLPRWVRGGQPFFGYL